ncbi:hypothetical protein CJ030_MR6G016561 [Morella rubra]|uniref:Uncharacterized protein n=1 Tax=Morella rubra TaxID=262757 RepID=A0A6A1VAY1_9ROSI|nr:hypothetical protein CJ030_MR6G016561 [Morella rubra]
MEGLLGTDYMQRIKEHGFIEVKNREGTASYPVTEESSMEHLSTNMHEACLQIDKECRVFTVHGSHGDIVNLEDAVEFDKIIPNLKLHIIEGANHGYIYHLEDLASVVVGIIKEVSGAEQGPTQ